MTKKKEPTETKEPYDVRSFEAGYMAGRTRVYLNQFVEASRELGYENPSLWKAKKFIIEREETIVILRNLCEKYGDNDWGNNLHLGDIIEKHLEPYLEEKNE